MAREDRIPEFPYVAFFSAQKADGRERLDSQKGNKAIQMRHISQDVANTL